MGESPARGTQLAVACSTAFLPPCLAVYMRWSTLPTISSTDCGGTRYVTTPMLAVSRQPCATTTSANASRSFWTTTRAGPVAVSRSEEHTSELQSQSNLVCRLLLEKKKKYDKLPVC